MIFSIICFLKEMSGSKTDVEIQVPRPSEITKIEWKKETTLKFAVYSVILVEYVNRLSSKLIQCVHCKVVIKATDGKITSLENDLKSGKKRSCGFDAAFYNNGVCV